MALACGMPWDTHAGHSIWKACRTVTLPRKESSVIGDEAFSHWLTDQDGAACNKGFIRKKLLNKSYGMIRKRYKPIGLSIII
jgi:hypothetical protein